MVNKGLPRSAAPRRGDAPARTVAKQRLIVGFAGLLR
jgi:hypothetical protein